jgi:hypothetical protein
MRTLKNEAREASALKPHSESKHNMTRQHCCILSHIAVVAGLLAASDSAGDIEYVDGIIRLSLSLFGSLSLFTLSLFLSLSLSLSVSLPFFLSLSFSLSPSLSLSLSLALCYVRQTRGCSTPSLIRQWRLHQQPTGFLLLLLLLACMLSDFD